MLLSITTTAPPATDLGYLLHKHPDKVQQFDLNFGTARVVYPRADAQRCEAVLTVEVPFPQDSAETYVSDRRFAAGSFLPTAISRVFTTALNGRCEARPELAAAAIPLEVMVTPIACRARIMPAELFEPLGWTVTDQPIPLDDHHPIWGAIHHRLILSGTQRLSDALRHLCLLLPVLDGTRHYYIGAAEIDRLTRLGEGWLDAHPTKAVIIRRYLRYRELIDAHAAQTLDPEAETEAEDEAIRPPRLQEQRITAITARLHERHAERVVDLGCGQGDLMASLLANTAVRHVLGVDPSLVNLMRAKTRLKLHRMPMTQRGRADLIQGAATYPDQRLSGYDAVAMLEVIEHIDPCRLAMVTDNVFGTIRPTLVLLTTPNREWNATIPALANGTMRHRDHRFEWTRSEFQTWGQTVADQHGYGFTTFPIGEVDEQYGPPTMGGEFVRK